MAIDWRKVGSLRLAGSPARWGEIRRAITLARSFGFEAHEVSVAEALEMFPYMVPDGIVGAAFMPSDGYVDPYSLTQAYAGTARKHGARLEENICVTGIIRQGRRVAGVVTITARSAATSWSTARGFGPSASARWLGSRSPPGWWSINIFSPRKSSTCRKPCQPCATPTIISTSSRMSVPLPSGAGNPAPGAAGARDRHSNSAANFSPKTWNGWNGSPCRAPRGFRCSTTSASRDIINGPIPVSADGEPIMGLAPELDNFYVACAFTAGIAASGGAGEAMANWILEGDPGLDLWSFDVRRFGAPHAVGRIWKTARSMLMASITRSIGLARRCAPRAGCAAARSMRR